jgi:hypothetical protein
VHAMFPLTVNELFAEASALTTTPVRESVEMREAWAIRVLVKRFALDVATIAAYYAPQRWLRALLLAATLGSYVAVKREMKVLLLAQVEADAAAGRMRKLYGRSLMKTFCFASLMYQLLGTAYALRWVSQDVFVSGRVHGPRRLRFHCIDGSHLACLCCFPSQESGVG